MAKARILDLIEGKEQSVVPSDYLRSGFYTPPGGEEVNTYDTGLGRSSIDLQQRIRNSNQTGLDMAANASKRLLQVPFSIVGNVASALDFEDYMNQDAEVGNWLTNAMESIKSDIVESAPIYRAEPGKPLDIGDPAWWWDNGSSLVESATAFVATGYLTGAGIGAIGKAANSIKWLNQLNNTTKVVQGAEWLANAAALNQAESIGIATNVYNDVYNQKLQEGLSPEVAKSAAATAASTSIDLNRINILLNITSAKAFIRPPQLTRQLLTKASLKHTGKEMLQEGFQEMGEETVNMIAENKARAEAAGKKYGWSEAMSDVLSMQGAENALLGFVGGAGQTALTQATKSIPVHRTDDGKLVSSNFLHNQRYEEQQKLIAQQNAIANVSGFKGLTDAFDSAEQQQALLGNLNAIAESGNKEQFEKAANNLLVYQAQRAFESGTTENLLDVYNKLGNFTDEQYQAQGLDPDLAKKKSAEAVETIKELESQFIEATNYQNTSQVYNTAANIILQEKLLNQYREDLSKATEKLSTRIDSGVKAGTYSTKSGASETVQEQGTNNTVTREKILSYNAEDILSGNNPNTGKAAASWNKTANYIRNTKEYRDAKNINSKVEALQQSIEGLKQQYDNITSDEFQNKLSGQTEFANKIQEVENNNPKKDAAYKEQIDEIVAESNLPEEVTQPIKANAQQAVEKTRVQDKSEVAEQPIEKPQSVDELFGYKEKDFFAGLQKPVAEEVDPITALFGEQKSIEEQIVEAATKQKSIAEKINPDTTEEFTEKSVIEQQPDEDTSKSPYQDASRLMFLNIPYRKTADEIKDGTDKVDYKYNIDPNNLLPGTKIYVKLAPHPDESKRIDDEKRPYQTKYMEVRTVDGDVLIGGLTNESHYNLSGEKPLYTNTEGTWHREIPLSVSEVQEQLENLNNFRQQVFENGRVDTTIEFKGYGQFNNSRGKKLQASVAKYQPTAELSYVGSEGRLFEGNELHPLFKNGQVINADKIASENHIGQTYSILQVRGKEHVAVPVWHKKLSETEIGNRIGDNILRTVDKFIGLPETERNVNLLIDHIRQFINWRGDAGNKNKYTKVQYAYNIIPKENALIVSRTDGKPIKEGVQYLRISNDMKVGQDAKNLILETMKEVLNESYTATSAKHMESNKEVKLGNDTWKYKDFLKELVHTNIEGIETEEGKYAYTVQPYINIDMKNVSVSRSSLEANKEAASTDVFKPVETLKTETKVTDLTKKQSAVERLKKADTRLSPGVPRDSKFSPVQLSDSARKEYYDQLVEGKSEQEILNSMNLVEIPVYTNDTGESVNLYHYSDETNPKWSALNGNLNSAKEALLNDRDIISETKYTPKVLSEEDVKIQNAQRSQNDPDYIEGLTADKVNEVVYYIINKFAQGLESATETPLHILDSINNSISEEIEVFKDLVTDDEYAEDRTRYEEHLKNLKTVLEHWNKIGKIAKRKFEKLSKFRDDRDVYENDEDVVDEVWDKASFEKDDKIRVGTELRLFLSGILDLNTDGSKKYNFLGLDKYIPWENAYNMLKDTLVDAPHDFDKVIKVLEAELQNKPWIQGVIDKLKTADPKIVTQFVARMPGHALKMVYTGYSDSKKGTSLRVMKTNTSSAKDVVFSKWHEQMYNKLYTVDDVSGEHVFNKEYSNKLIEEFNSWSNPDDNVVRTWLENVGITFNDIAWRNIVNNGYVHNKQKTSWEQLLKDKKLQANSPSFLVQIVNGLNRAVSEISLDDETNDASNHDSPITDSVITKTLANIEASTSTEYRPNSFREGEKQLYSYILEQKTTDRLNWLKQDADNLLNKKEPEYFVLQQLLSTEFAKGSSWLNSLTADTEAGKHFRSVFDVQHLSLTALKELGKRYSDDRAIQSLDDSEHELVKVGLFQDLKQGTSKYGRTIKTFFPTLSDKSQMILVQTIAEDFGTIDSKYIDKEGNITDDGWKRLYSLLIKPEVDRIFQFNQFGKQINISGYKDGASKFIMFPELNDVDIDGKKVVELLDTNGEETPAKIFEQVEEALTTRLKSIINFIVTDKVQDWKDLGIDTKLDRGYTSTLIGNKLQTAAQDYVINYLISNAESFKVFIGDPAQYWKKNLFVTDINITKRLASNIAPGTKLANSDSGKYTQVFLDDTKISSKALSELQELLGEDADIYSGIEGTDAQEFTTVLEELYVAYNNGEISKDFYDVVSSVIYSEINKGNHYYMSELKKAIKDSPFEDDFNDWILQARKPVYTGDYFQNEDHPVMRDMYIKSSSFSLHPDVTAGKEIDKLRIGLEKLEAKKILIKEGSIVGGTVRASFKTANKVGAPEVSLPIMNSEGDFLSYDTDIYEAHSLTLDRRNFKIQQEVPFKGEKEEINRGTQESKTIFTNLLDVDGFDWNGKKVKGYSLYKEYETRMSKIFELQSQKLLEELGQESFEDVANTLASNDVEKKKKLLQTVVDILREEALDRDYPKKDVLALSVTEDGELALPLWLAASHYRYENLLTAIVRNRVLKMGMPGAPFVLGTEEGFKTTVSETVPQSNKIVYTDKWTGSLKPAIQNGGFAQVLVPSRFKRNGRLVDMKKFATKVDGKWILDNTKVDPDLLKIFGFRIPTSGLMSMSGIEIVGFLSEEMGDLIIAPRDFTKQMGSDFDIDKLYTYMKYHKVNDKIEVDNSDETKQLKNDIIDIHHSIMSNNNKAVQEQILRPLSTDHIEKQAELVDSVSVKRKYRTLLNDTWQRDKLIQLASGKIGVGTTSLDVTFHSIAQIANATGSPLTLMTKEGKPISLKIDKVSSSGKLGLEKTLDGQEYISVANSEMQNAAVDNATVQAFGKLNINDLTFAAERTLRLLGFDKGSDGNNIRYMLLSQPIIKDYVQMMRKQMSALSEYNPNYERDIVNALLDKYKTSSNIDLGFKNDLKDSFVKGTAEITSEKLFNSLKPPTKQSFTEGDIYQSFYDSETGEIIEPSEEEKAKFLEQNMKETEATFNARVNSFNKLQGQVLDLFLVADYYGKEIAKVQQIMNIDSRGFGKSIPEVIQAVSKAEKTIAGGSIANVSELIGVILPETSDEWKAIQDTEKAKDFIKFGKLRIKPSHISGSALAYGLGSAYNMWQHLFPYQQAGFNNLVNSIQANSKVNDDASITKLADFQAHILGEFKKAIYSDVISAGLSTDEVTDVRQKLFFDTDTNKSLASYIDTIKPLMNNSFINRLETHIVNTGLPSRISYNNAAADDIDENIIYDAAFSLFANNYNLPAFNGEEMTTRKLIQYLTLYAYAGDPIQQATQFVKFIPNEVLELSGANEYARNINRRIMSNDEDLYLGFERQYFQHNPTKTTQLPMEMLEEMTGIKGKEIVNAEEFTATQSFVEEYGEVKYVSYYIDNLNNVNKRNRWRLFELLQDGKYHRIPVLGVFGMNEYQLGQNFVKSIVNNISSEVKQEKIVSQQQVVPDKKADILGYEYKDGDSINGILNKISNTSVNENFKNLAEYYKDKLGSSTISVNPSLSLDEARYYPKSNRIEIGTKYSSNEAFERAVLHEITHALTLQKLREPGNSDIKKNLLKLKNQARKILAEKYGVEAIQKAAERFKKSGTLTNTERQRFYGILTLENDTSGLEEFVTQIMTEPEFQKELNVKAEGFEKSILERFLDLIRRLLVRTGILPESITAHAINQVLNLIEGEVLQTKTEVTDFFAGLKPKQSTQQQSKEVSNSDFFSGLKTPPTTFEEFRDSLQKKCN